MARVDALKCGDCGGDRFKLRHIMPEGAARFGGGTLVQGQIRVVCQKCSSVSVIGVAAALTTEGHLCGGWGKKK